MRVENTKVKLTISIPIDKPDDNGVIYTREAIENAVNNLHTNLPIIYRDNESAIDGMVIGATTGNSHIVTWDSENQVCKMTVNGVVFYSGADILVNDIKDGKITDFEIVSIGLSK
ncbi:MAG: hypothetical protein PUE12_18030 [Oscillospiraceae bacterium]|nr:hypothetical protein [Oscillospiraceae bacterium]